MKLFLVEVDSTARALDPPRTLDAIPIMADGSLDPAFDPVTGVLRSGQTKHPQSFITDAGNVYSTALQLAGVDPAGKGRNMRDPLTFI